MHEYKITNHSIAIPIAGVLYSALLLIGLLTSFSANAQAQVVPTSTNTTISIEDDVFVDGNITVSEGTTITWTNNGDDDHTVTADDGSFDSGTLNPGESFTHTFATAGTYPYYCEFHGDEGGAGMSATIMVTALAATTTDTSSTSTATTTSSTSTDVTPPIISSVSATSTSEGEQAIINWVTDEAANSQVAYGTSSTYSTYSMLDSEFVMDHSLTLSSLVPDTTYHFQVISTDENGNTAYSNDLTFIASATTSTATTTDTDTDTDTDTNTDTGTTSTTTSTTTSPIDLQTLRDLLIQLLDKVIALQAKVDQALGNNNGGSGGTGTTTPSGSATLTPSSITLKAGDSIDFNGRNFGVEESIRVSRDGLHILTTHADGGGNFSTGSITVPATAGTYEYKFVGQNSGISRSSFVQVTQ